MAVTTDNVDGSEDAELDFRALAEYLTVLDDGDFRARSSPGLYTVTSESGSTYLVDPELPACECEDFEYRDRVCKHIRRCQFATGRREVPNWISESDIDDQLGIHVDDVQDDEDDLDRGDGLETDGGTNLTCNGCGTGLSWGDEYQLDEGDDFDAVCPDCYHGRKAKGDLDRGEGVETDGGTETQGAIDREFDDAEQSYDDRVAEALADVPTEPLEQGVAIDIVTRQAVYIRQQVAATCREYYHENSFDLVTYKMHPWLPGISAENAVYECVYIDGNPQNAHKPGKTYDFPSARLLPLPLPMAWDAFEVGEL